MYNPDDITLPHYLGGEHLTTSPILKKTQEENPDFSEYYEPKDKNWLHGCHSHIQDKEELKKDIAIYYGMISIDRKSTRLNSSHANISYAVFCLKKKKKKNIHITEA